MKPDPRDQKIGLLGGSFNPAHDGHVYISEQSIKLLGLDEVWWLVSPQNPLKPMEGMAPLNDRVKSAEKIVRNHAIKISTIESDLATQYTIDAIRELQRRYSTTRFIWLMGADNLVECHKWQDWELIFKSVPVAIFDRASYKEEALNSICAKRFAQNKIEEEDSIGLAEKQTPSWVYLDIQTHSASSTAIREDAG